jgi:hypothetical protein
MCEVEALEGQRGCSRGIPPPELRSLVIPSMVWWLVTRVVGHLTLTQWYSRFSITTVRNTPLLSDVNVMSQGGKHRIQRLPLFPRSGIRCQRGKHA